MKKIFLVLVILHAFQAKSQLLDIFSGKEKPKTTEMLISNRGVQIEAGTALNLMYNCKFDDADREFRWFAAKYPTHPIGPFLQGLNEWWKIVPNPGISEFDEAIHTHMDKAISLANDMLDDDANNKEAAFFISTAYAFKGRVYAEREKWTKAAWAGKQSLKYLEKSRIKDDDLSAELIIGDGLYNFYSKWIPENYPNLKLILTFFKKGNKAKGIQQLEYVANNAFYTRHEARYFLVQLYSSEGEHKKAYDMAKYMHQTFPENAFFHRYLARSAFMLAKNQEAEKVALELLENVDKMKFGYEGTAGRYAAFIIAYINQHYNKNYEKASEYYKKTIVFAEQTKSFDSGYYLGSNIALGKIADMQKDYTAAETYYRIALNNADRKSDTHKEAKKLLEDNKKMQKVERKKKG